MNKKKQHINIAFTGALNSGKSTTVGHIIYNCGAIHKNDFKIIENEAKKQGNDNQKYAFILDKQKEEQKKKITMNISHWNIESQNYSITLIDTPGLLDHINKTISGILQADFLVLIIDATAKQTNQIHNQLLTAYALGIDQVIIAINKMDDKNINFNEQKYKAVKKDLIPLISQTGYSKEQIRFIPISGLAGENLTGSSSKLSWWMKGTLIQLIDYFETPTNFLKKPLRLPILDFLNVPDLGTVIKGPILSGTIKEGQNILLSPTGIKAVSKSIKKNHNRVKEATPGDYISINIDVPFSRLETGMIIGDQTNDPPISTVSFLAKMFILNNPDQIKNGYTLSFRFQHQTVPCKLVALMSRTDSKGSVKESPTYAKVNDVIVAKVKPSKPLTVEMFKKCQPMGKFVIVDKKDTVVAVGTVSSVQKELTNLKEKERPKKKHEDEENDDDDEDSKSDEKKHPKPKPKSIRKKNESDDSDSDHEPPKLKTKPKPKPKPKIESGDDSDSDHEPPKLKTKPKPKPKSKIESSDDSDSDQEPPKPKPKPKPKVESSDESDSDEKKPPKSKLDKASKPAKAKLKITKPKVRPVDDENEDSKPSKAKNRQVLSPKKKPAEDRDDETKPTKIKDKPAVKPKKKPADSDDDSDDEAVKVKPNKKRVDDSDSDDVKPSKVSCDSSSEIIIPDDDEDDEESCQRNKSFWISIIDAQNADEFYDCFFKSNAK